MGVGFFLCVTKQNSNIHLDCVTVKLFFLFWISLLGEWNQEKDNNEALWRRKKNLDSLWKHKRSNKKKHPNVVCKDISHVFNVYCYQKFGWSKFSVKIRLMQKQQQGQLSPSSSSKQSSSFFHHIHTHGFIHPPSVFSSIFLHLWAGKQHNPHQR